MNTQSPTVDLAATAAECIIGLHGEPPELPRYKQVPKSEFSAARITSVRQSGPHKAVVTVVSESGQTHDVEVDECVCTQHGNRNGYCLEGYWLLIERGPGSEAGHASIIDPARFHHEFELEESE